MAPPNLPAKSPVKPSVKPLAPKQQLVALTVAGALTYGTWGLIQARQLSDFIAPTVFFAGGEVLRRKHKLSPDVVMNQLLGAANDVLAGVQESLTTPAYEGGESLFSSVVKQLPFGEQLMHKASEQAYPIDWLVSYESHFLAIGGEQREGKSYILRERCLRFLRQTQNTVGAALHICDVDATSHPKSFWFDLEEGTHIHRDLSEVYQLFVWLTQEIDDRPGNGQDPPLMIAFDELVNSLPYFSAAEREFILKTLLKVRTKGEKRNIWFAASLHSFSVGETTLKKTFFAAFDYVILWKLAQEDDTFSNLTISDKTKNLIGEFRTLPPQIYGLRLALLRFQKQWHIAGVPDITLTPLTLHALPDSSDTTHPLIQQLNSIEFGDVKLTYTLACDSIHFPRKHRVLNNNNYLIIREWVDAQNVFGALDAASSKTEGAIEESAEAV